MSATKKLIVIEGIDRSGKTSLIAYLKAKIACSVATISFPNRKSFTGELIDKYLTNRVTLNAQTIHLLFSANRWEMMDHFQAPGCEIVLCDRYYFSGIAYTAAKGVPIEWCSKPDQGLTEPDLVMFIDVRAEEVASRPGFGNEKYEKVEYQRKVYKLLKGLVEEHANGRVVCGDGSVEEIGDRMMEVIGEFLSK